MLNRYEARQAARAVANGWLERPDMAPRSRKSVEEALAMRSPQCEIYLGRHRGQGTLGVPCADLERECRKMVEDAGQEVPEGASFKAGVDPSGELAGACLQWYVLGEDKDA
jgi:hypothetical protein